MWFNILKNEGRRAAYRFYVNSLVHLGEFRPPKTRPKKTGGIYGPYFFKSSNGHLKWEVTYDTWGKLDSFGLIEMPDFVEPYKEYIQGMFENEYPEQYAALQNFFVENGPGPPTDEVPVPIEDLIKDATEKMESHFKIFIDELTHTLNYRYEVTDGYSRDLHRELESYLPASITVLSALPFRPSALRIMKIYQDIIRDNLQQGPNHMFIWENFINLVVNFRDKYVDTYRVRGHEYLSAENIRRTELMNVISFNSPTVVRIIHDSFLVNNEQDLKTFVDNLQ